MNKEIAEKVINEFSQMLIEEFTKEREYKGFERAKGVFKNLCPIKVEKVKKEINKKYGIEE